MHQALVRRFGPYDVAKHQGQGYLGRLRAPETRVRPIRAMLLHGFLVRLALLAVRIRPFVYLQGAVKPVADLVQCALHGQSGGAGSPECRGNDDQQHYGRGGGSWLAP